MPPHPLFYLLVMLTLAMAAALSSTLTTLQWKKARADRAAVMVIRAEAIQLANKTLLEGIIANIEIIKIKPGVDNWALSHSLVCARALLERKVK